MVAEFLRKHRPEIVAEAGNRFEQRAVWTITSNGYSAYERFAELENQWHTIAPSFGAILAGPNDRLQRVCSALRHFMVNTGRWDEWLFLCRSAERIGCNAGDFKEAGWRAYQAGYVHYLRGEVEELDACATRVEEYWDQPGIETREKGVAIRMRGLVHFRNKRFAEARDYFHLTLHQTIAQASREVATDLAHLAEAEERLGHPDTAKLHHEETLRIGRLFESIEGEAVTRGKLSTLLLEEGDWAGAEVKAMEALSLAQKAGRKDMIASNGCRLAKALLRQGRTAEALPHVQRAVDIYTRLCSPELELARATLRECEGNRSAG